MIVQRTYIAAAAVCVGLLAGLPAAMADDLVKIASGTIGDWDVSVPDFGKRAGIFHKHGIDVDVSYNDGSAPTIQATIAGSVDVGLGVGVAGFLAPAVKGAPIKMFTSQYTGAPDLEWFVRADSPIRSFKDIKDDTTIAFSSNGSSSNITLLALLAQAGVKGRPVAGGSQSAILTALMSGQLDVGYDSDGGLALGDARGKVRVIGSGADLPDFRDLTVRTNIARTDNLMKRRDVFIRFMQAYQETIDWMYQDPQPLQWYAEAKHVSVAEAQRVRDHIYPKQGMRLGAVHGVALNIKQAVDFKRIDAPITPEQFAQYVDIVWSPSP
jgi:NitT/TauT family transport system substrate-binding protein